MPSESEARQIPVRVKMRIEAVGLWAFLSIPSIAVTVCLFVANFGSDNDDKEQTDFSNSTKAIERLAEQSANVTYECYENFTIYYPLYNNAKFWIEGVLLILVGTLGLFGNFLTLAVLSQSKKSTFNQLLIALSICDSLLIVFFILVSTSTTVMKDMPEWFIYIFPYLLWPLGNISITSTVLMVVAVSTERYLAICRPLQYKPSPVFYILLVFLTSFGVNFGRFLEFTIEMVEMGENGTLPVFEPTALMSDERYIMFSRYWTEIIVNGILPLLALIGLNYGIYLKIRKSARFRKLNGTSGFVMRFKAKRQSMPNTEENIALQHLHVNHNWDNGRLSEGESTLNGNTASVTVNRPKSPSSMEADNVQVLPLNQSSNSLGQELVTSAPSGGGSNERCTKVLVGIVVVFLVCHLVRLVLQIDAVVHPSSSGSEHFMYCRHKDRFHSPYIVYILTCFNTFCLVLNSSINFVVYCMAGRSFRTTLIALFCKEHARQERARIELRRSTRFAETIGNGISSNNVIIHAIEINR